MADAKQAVKQEAAAAKEAVKQAAAAAKEAAKQEAAKAKAEAAAIKNARKERDKEQKKLQKLWKKLDADLSGSLDTDEIRRVLANMGETDPTEEEFKAAMAEMDSDGSGEVRTAHNCAARVPEGFAGLEPCGCC